MVATVLFIFAASAVYVRIHFPGEPAEEEFSVYDAVLHRLSNDWTSSPVHSPPDRFALAKRTSKLTELPYDEHIPAELRPYSREKAGAPTWLTDFCGYLCGLNFVRKNMRSSELKPAANETLPFELVASSTELKATNSAVRIVRVSRPGFDLWHRRAVLLYSFNCGHDGSSAQIALLCGQSGYVLLQKEHGAWQVRDYSGVMR